MLAPMKLTFRLLENDFVVARLQPDEPIPKSALQGSFWSLTKTDDELSIVTAAEFAPSASVVEGEWRALKLLGPIPFEMTGVAAGFTAPLAQRGISVFVISTFDTDYLLVKSVNVERAVEALRESGYEVE